MAFIGHAPAEIAAELGQPTLLVWEWTTSEHRLLPAPTAAAVDRLYRARCLTPGTNEEIAAYARTQRWASALAWDDDTLDDLWAQPDLGRPGTPDHIIDPIALELALAGRRTVSARLTSRERHTVHCHRQISALIMSGPVPPPPVSRARKTPRPCCRRS